MRRVEGYEARQALVMRVEALRDARVATPPGTITEATVIPCQGTARHERRRLAVATGGGRIMLTHAHRAHWYAQETVAKTLLAAACAKRLAAQGRLIHVRGATYRWRVIAVWWGKVRWPMRARGVGRIHFLLRGTS
jgi:uncharacterized membrane protein YecN with MAPEG domain